MSGKNNEDQIDKVSPALSLSHAAAVAFLTFVVTSGGWYGGFHVSEQSPQQTVSTLIPGFDESIHVVTRVVDGDTVIIDDMHKVRLIGIDAPEEGSCYGTESAEYVSQLLLGQEVLLRKDSEAKDSLDRLLRYVFTYHSDPEKDHVFVNQLLLNKGMGHLSFKGENRLHADIMQVAYGIAKNNGRGIHGVCEPVEEVLLEAPSGQHVIKGNSKPSNKTKIYYLPGCPNYDLILMRKSEGDEYFVTEDEAVQAGFTKAANCKVEFGPVGI